MTTRKTVKPSRGRVPNDPLDWVDGVGQTNSEETPAVTQPVAEKLENVSAPPVQKQTLIERKQEKMMSEIKNIEPSGRCEAIGEIRRVAEAVKNGNLAVRADVSGLKGECAEAAAAINGMVTWFSQQQEQINDFTNDMQHMSREHDKGDIDVAIDATKFKGGFADMATGVNAMVFGHIAVKKKAMACLKAFGEGDFNAELEQFPGKKAFINDTIELLRSNLKGFTHDMQHMSTEHDKGDIDVAIDVTKFKGGFADMATGVNVMVLGHIAVKKKAMACIKAFSEGNFNAELELFPGKKVFINETIELMRVNLRALVADASVLSVAAVEGKLATRADASKHQGDFRKIVEGVNDTLDAVIGPLNVAAEYVENIAKGAIPAKITATYNGDFNILKSNLNTCIDAVNALVADASVLSVAAVEGKLATRADASKHQGDYRKIVEGVNSTLDAVIGPLNVAADYVENIAKGEIPAKITATYNGDFNILKNNLNTCIDAVNGLVADAGVLSVAAVEGKLATRADASKHQGDFRKIVEGVNDTLDAVIGPLNVAADYVDNISKGAIPAKITDI